MFLFTFLSPLNLFIIFLSIASAYFHWSLPVLFILLDIIFLRLTQKNYSLCKTSFTWGQKAPVLYKRRLVWYKNPTLRKRMCGFEALCRNVQVDISQMDLSDNTATAENMKSVLLQLQKEFIDGLYEYSVILKNRHSADIESVSQKLRSIEERLQVLRNSVDIAGVNYRKISELSGVMNTMSQNVLKNLNLKP